MLLWFNLVADISSGDESRTTPHAARTMVLPHGQRLLLKYRLACFIRLSGAICIYVKSPEFRERKEEFDRGESDLMLPRATRSLRHASAKQPNLQQSRQWQRSFATAVKDGNLQVNRLSGALGAEIRGVDLRSIDDSKAKQIRQTFLDNHVILLPGSRACSKRVSGLQCVLRSATRVPNGAWHRWLSGDHRGS